MPVGARGHRYVNPRCTPQGIDLVAQAEGVLYPGTDPEALTWPQQWAAVKLAKQHLIDLGKWPLATHQNPRGRDKSKRTRKAA